MDAFGRNAGFDFGSTFERARGEEAEVKHSLSGASILDFAERQIDSSVNLLGNRWISRLAGGFIVAPSGHGKSSLIMQMGACFACGRICCGIKAPHPLRVFIAQAEDDNNDVIEMAQMLNRLNLNAKELELVRVNTHVEWLNDCTGDRFFRALEQLLQAWQPCDLLFINPYTAYLGEDIQDTKANSSFLRVKLAALMAKFNLGVLIVHHTGKTQFQKKKEFAWFDWMYDMAGGAILTNWARAVLVVAPSNLPGTYKFIAAKRFEKIGWQQREYWFSHSLEGERMLWIPATEEQIQAAEEDTETAASGAKKDNEVQNVLKLIPALDPIHQEILFQKASPGEKRVRQILKLLLAEDKIFQHKLPSNGGRPAIGYAKLPQSSE